MQFERHRIRIKYKKVRSEDWARTNPRFSERSQKSLGSVTSSETWFSQIWGSRLFPVASLCRWRVFFWVNEHNALCYLFNFPPSWIPDLVGISIITEEKAARFNYVEDFKVPKEKRLVLVCSTEFCHCRGYLHLFFSTHRRGRAEITCKTYCIIQREFATYRIEADYGPIKLKVRASLHNTHCAPRAPRAPPSGGCSDLHLSIGPAQSQCWLPSFENQ